MAAPDPVKAFIESVEHYRPLIRQHRPDIALPAEQDVWRWHAVDVHTFSDAMNEWHRYCTSVDDRVALFLHVGIELSALEGVSLAPEGFDEALRDNDVSELDRLMSAIEQQRPELFTLPG